MKRTAWYNVILGVFGLELRRKVVRRVKEPHASPETPRV